MTTTPATLAGADQTHAVVAGLFSCAHTGEGVEERVSGSERARDDREEGKDMWEEGEDEQKGFKEK